MYNMRGYINLLSTDSNNLASVSLKYGGKGQGWPLNGTFESVTFAKNA